jgi:hypothetical protein
VEKIFTKLTRIGTDSGPWFAAGLGVVVKTYIFTKPILKVLT